MPMPSSPLPLLLQLVLEQRSGIVQIYNAKTMNKERAIDLQRGAPTAAHYIRETKSVVFCFGNSIMGLWDFSADIGGEPKYELRMSEDGRTPMCWLVDFLNDSQGNRK